MSLNDMIFFMLKNGWTFKPVGSKNLVISKNHVRIAIHFEMLDVEFLIGLMLQEAAETAKHDGAVEQQLKNE